MLHTISVSSQTMRHDVFLADVECTILEGKQAISLK